MTGANIDKIETANKQVDIEQQINNHELKQESRLKNDKIKVFKWLKSQWRIVTINLGGVLIDLHPASMACLRQARQVLGGEDEIALGVMLLSLTAFHHNTNIKVFKDHQEVYSLPAPFVSFAIELIDKIFRESQENFKKAKIEVEKKNTS